MLPVRLSKAHAGPSQPSWWPAGGASFCCPCLAVPQQLQLTPIRCSNWLLSACWVAALPASATNHALFFAHVYRAALVVDGACSNPITQLLTHTLSDFGYHVTLLERPTQQQLTSSLQDLLVGNPELLQRRSAAAMLPAFGSVRLAEWQLQTDRCPEPQQNPVPMACQDHRGPPG